MDSARPCLGDGGGRPSEVCTACKADRNASSLGVRNRQPQGQLVPYSFGGGGILDSGSPLYVFVKIPDRVDTIHEALVTLAFRQFLAPATAAASGGGSTSGPSSESSSSNGSESFNLEVNGTHLHTNPEGGNTGSANGMNSPSLGTSIVVAAGGHNHPIPHFHSTPAHGHGLTYGTFEETFPVSHSVTLKVYERDDTTWVLRGTFAGLTTDLEDVDLTSVMTGAGDWRLTVQSEAAQPNGGRLGCDVYGAVTGSIQSA